MDGAQDKTSPGVTLSLDPEQARKEVWLNAWLNVARAEDCKRATIATGWADECLAKFDARFKR